MTDLSPKVEEQEVTSEYTEDEAFLILCMTRERSCKVGDCKTCGWRNKDARP